MNAAQMTPEALAEKVGYMSTDKIQIVIEVLKRSLAAKDYPELAPTYSLQAVRDAIFSLTRYGEQDGPYDLIAVFTGRPYDEIDQIPMLDLLAELTQSQLHTVVYYSQALLSRHTKGAITA